MRKEVLPLLSAFLVAISAGQIENSAGGSVLRKARATHPQVQQLRDASALDSLNWPTARAHWSLAEHHGLSAPRAIENKSCDIIWCYKN
jgi:hypothetical protein